MNSFIVIIQLTNVCRQNVLYGTTYSYNSYSTAISKLICANCCDEINMLCLNSLINNIMNHVLLPLIRRLYFTYYHWVEKVKPLITTSRVDSGQRFA